MILKTHMKKKVHCEHLGKAHSVNTRTLKLAGAGNSQAVVNREKHWTHHQRRTSQRFCLSEFWRDPTQTVGGDGARRSRFIHWYFIRHPNIKFYVGNLEFKSFTFLCHKKEIQYPVAMRSDTLCRKENHSPQLFFEIRPTTSFNFWKPWGHVTHFLCHL